jgi:hypothetical protein
LLITSNQSVLSLGGTDGSFDRQAKKKFRAAPAFFCGASYPARTMNFRMRGDGKKAGPMRQAPDDDRILSSIQAIRAPR